MKRKYRSIGIKDVSANLVSKFSGPITIGLDVAKETVFAVVRSAEGEFLRPWKVQQPTEVREFVAVLKEISRDRDVVIALESTGTYGDALRQAMTDAGLKVHRVSGKAKSDYEEIFDGVPSAHDGKDAAIIAELAGLGKSRPWSYEQASDLESELRTNVSWLDAQQDILQVWIGRVEALLARHWPEATCILDLTSSTLLHVLAHYGNPARVAADREASKRLESWGGSFLKVAKIQKLLDSAKTTVGVRMSSAEENQVKRIAAEALKAHQNVSKAKSTLKKTCPKHKPLQAMEAVLGGTTAAVLWACLGNPENYHCAEAYRKAMGLNLKERSSGKYQGKLKITKRGSSTARRWLYFAALRYSQMPGIRSWYENKKRKDSGKGRRAIVAIMRKLALAIWHVVVRGKPFEVWRLFPGRPLTEITMV